MPPLFIYADALMRYAICYAKIICLICSILRAMSTYKSGGTLAVYAFHDLRRLSLLSIIDIVTRCQYYVLPRRLMPASA